MGKYYVKTVKWIILVLLTTRQLFISLQTALQLHALAINIFRLMTFTKMSLKLVTGRETIMNHRLV